MVAKTMIEISMTLPIARWTETHQDSFPMIPSKKKKRKDRPMIIIYSVACISMLTCQQVLIQIHIHQV